jgi:hypothetical protein
MKKHLLSFLLGFVIAGCIVFLVMHHRSRQGSAVWAAGELMSVRQAVEKRLLDISQDITARLAAFGQETAADQIFALRLIAESNPSAPEVAGKAGGFMAPMGFAFLSIVDSAGTILSSGHFPASSGDRMDTAAFKKLGDEPRLVEDNAAGKKTLSLQARSAFMVADNMKFYALGGVAVDGAFLARLSPMPGVKVLLKRGGEVIGMENVKTMSEVNNNAVLINGTEYPAFAIPLDFAGQGDAPELLGVMKK